MGNEPCVLWTTLLPVLITRSLTHSYEQQEVLIKKQTGTYDCLETERQATGHEAEGDTVLTPSPSPFPPGDSASPWSVC